MEPFSINELGGLITVVAGAIATVLFALQKSRCTDIRCCGLACRRDPALIAQAREDGSAQPERRRSAEALASDHHVPGCLARGSASHPRRAAPAPSWLL